MNQKDRDKIMKYIFYKYTGQQVCECLSVEIPISYKLYYDMNINKNKRLK